MSLQSFQSALAYVIRSFDTENTKKLDELSSKFELSSEEKITLENLIHQQRLKAYSEELFFARWTIIREALEFLQPFIDFKELNILWERDFEPNSNQIIHEDLVLKFVEFLVFSQTGSKFISTDKPAFLPSLMRYLYTVFTFKHNYLPKRGPLPHSVLTDRYFEVISLQYDVREFFAQLVELDDFTNIQLTPPPKSQITMLFIASDEVTEFRSFEIDEVLANFFTGQLRGEKASTESVSCYDDLVDMGLCQPRSKLQ